jgi:hypothetical protein
MEKYFYDSQGNLNVWTGTGYQLIPKAGAGDFGQWSKPIYGMFSSGDGESWGQIGQEEGWGLTNAGLFQNGLLNPFDQRDSNNFMWQAGDQNGATYLLKNADKQGTEIQYVRQQDGSYMPVVKGFQDWNTNPTSRNIAALAMATIAAGGALAAGGGFGGGAGAASGTGAASGAGAGSVAASSGGSLLGELTAGGLTGGATGSAGTFGGMTAGGSLSGLTAGSSALVPSSLAGSLGPGFAAGLGGLGSITPTASTLAAWDALAPSITGVAGSSPGMFDGLMDKAGNYLTDPKNLSTIVKAGGLLSGMVGGANSGDNTTAGGPRSVAPSTIPQMYGGSPQGLLGGWGQMGPTETERRMRQNYLPSLLGAGPWGY